MKQGGFTIIEVLVATVLISVLGLGIAIISNSVQQNQLTTWRNYITVDQANTAITPMIREIRTARAAQTGSYTIELANANEIIFYSDYDNDNDTERIRYTRVNNTLEKGIIEPVGFPPTYPLNQEVVRPVTDQIRNQAEPIFYYFNGNWPADTANNPLATPAQVSEVKLVRIYLRINTIENDPGSDYILESYSQLRMLKDNL